MRGAAPTPASDIYALGVLLFRLLSGVYPYAADDLDGLLRLQDGGKRARLADLQPGAPRDLLRTIDGALERDPAKRHASALAFATALAPSPPRVANAWRASHFVIAAMAAIVALAVALAVSFWPGVRAPAWQADVAFYRIDARGGTALTDGTSITLGDRLALKFRSDRPAYVYIFNETGRVKPRYCFRLPESSQPTRWRQMSPISCRARQPRPR